MRSTQREQTIARLARSEPFPLSPGYKSLVTNITNKLLTSGCISAHIHLLAKVYILHIHVHIHIYISRPGLAISVSRKSVTAQYSINLLLYVHMLECYINVHDTYMYMYMNVYMAYHVHVQVYTTYIWHIMYKFIQRIRRTEGNYLYPPQSTHTYMYPH